MLFEEHERLKIRFLAAFDRLYDKGLLSKEERDEVVELLDGMDELPPEEFTARIQAIRDRVAQRAESPAQAGPTAPDAQEGGENGDGR